MAILDDTPVYLYNEYFSTFAFVHKNGFFCELEPDAKGASLGEEAKSITKICLSPCRVTDPFISRQEAIERIPKDRRFVIVSYNHRKEETFLTLKVFKTWAEKINKTRSQKQDLMVEFTTHLKDYKSELFRVEKLTSIDQAEYDQYQKFYTRHFVSNLKKYAAEELRKESGGRVSAQWTQTIPKSKVGAAIKRLKEENPDLITTNEELFASLAIAYKIPNFPVIKTIGELRTSINAKIAKEETLKDLRTSKEVQTDGSIDEIYEEDKEVEKEKEECVIL